MASSYSESLAIANAATKSILAIACEAAIASGWQITDIRENGFTATTGMSWRSWGEMIEVTVKGSHLVITSTGTQWQLTDFGKNKKNTHTYLASFAAIQANSDATALENKLDTLNDFHRQMNADALPQMPANGGGWKWLLLPRSDYAVTPIIVYLNLLVFILMLFAGVNIFNPNAADLMAFGANYRPLTMAGEVWRLLTNCFVHIGIIHLMLNLFALVNIGFLLEPIIGKTRFAVAYLLSGIGASAVSLWWHTDAVSAGASGAIFGMFGLFLVLMLAKTVEATVRTALLGSVIAFIAYNLLYGLKGSVDNAAHIGGLISGIICGVILVPSLQKSWNEDLKLVTIGIATVAIIGGSYFLYTKSHDDLPVYQAKMKKFDTMQRLALEIYQLPEGTPKEEILSEIKEKGIYYWDEIEQLLNETEKLEIPESYHQRNKQLLEYARLRNKSYNMLYLFVQTDEARFKDSMERYNKAIEKLSEEIKY